MEILKLPGHRWQEGLIETYNIQPNQLVYGWQNLKLKGQ